MPESSVRPRRIVVGVSGASGAALGLECLKCLRQAGAESALVVTRGGEITIEQELGMTLDEFFDCARNCDPAFAFAVVTLPFTVMSKSLDTFVY